MTRFLSSLALSGCLVGCATAAPGREQSRTPAQSAAQPGGTELVVYAASSLSDSFQALAGAYEKAHTGVRIVLAFDSSSALRTRIEEGAPADVFASADTANTERLIRAGLTSGPVVSFARNRLAIVVPADNPAGIQQPVDLGRPGVRVVMANEAVPINEYAIELLGRLATAPGAPSDLVARVQANVVSREDNVRAVLAKVQLGEGDAGFVYETDARSAKDVQSIPIPDQVNVSAVYSAIAVARGPALGPALDFARWLRGSEAQGILAAAGFLQPP